MEQVEAGIERYMAALETADRMLLQFRARSA
jgi:hypothetical protein